MRATVLLEEQHRKVDSLFESLEASPAGAGQLDELATLLACHAAIEEEIFYPAAKRFNKEMVLESHEEHELMAYALKRLVAADPSGQSFKARIKACKDVVKHHVQEEEQELLPQMAEALGEQEDEALGKEMEARFKELWKGGYEAAIEARKARRSTNGHGAKTASRHGKSTSSGAKKKASHAPRRAA